MNVEDVITLSPRLFLTIPLTALRYLPFLCKKSAHGAFSQRTIQRSGGAPPHV